LLAGENSTLESKLASSYSKQVTSRSIAIQNVWS
jgi:hypothetical protein